MKSIGDALPTSGFTHRPDDLPPTQARIMIPNSTGQPPLFLTPQEIAAAGGRQVTNPHTGQRVWQFGLWQENGEWVYPPFHHPDDLDGSRYRAGLVALREQHKAYAKRHEGRPTRATRRFDGDD